MSRKHIAVYCRVSGTKQSTESQHEDLNRWLTAYNSEGEDVVWYEDTSNEHVRMDRKNWKRLESAYKNGRVSKLIVWKVDRLGRNAARLLELFNDLAKHCVEFHSIRESLSSTSPFFKLVAGILASIAEWENETRSQRIRAGLKVSLRKRKSRSGMRYKVTEEHLRSIARELKKGTSGRKIAKKMRLSESHVREIKNDLVNGGLQIPNQSSKRKKKHYKLDPNDVAVFKNMVKENWSPTVIADELGISRSHYYRLHKLYFNDQGTERPVSIVHSVENDPVEEALDMAADVDFGVNLFDYYEED